MARVPPTRSRTFKTLGIIPDPLQPGLSAAEREAITVRNRATIELTCPRCGARAPKARIRRGEVKIVPIVHEVGCLAASPLIEEAAERLGSSLRYTTVVYELQVAA
jgi:hypothetical protein